LKSPYGSRGSICAHFGWTYDYLLWGIPWPIVQRMLIDAPSYESKKGDSDKKAKPKVMNHDQLADFLQSINTLPR